MWTLSDSKNHAAAQASVWCKPAMHRPNLASTFVCTKIRPVRLSGGPFRGGSS